MGSAKTSLKNNLAGILPVLMLAVCLVLTASAGFGAPTPLAENPPAGQPPAPDGPAAQRKLVDIQLGTLPEYSRFIFTFSTPVPRYTVRRVEVDQIWIDFGDATADGQGRLDFHDEAIEGLAVSRSDDRLTAKIKVRSTRFDFRHFAEPDALRIVLDIRPAERTRIENQTKARPKPKSINLELPSPPEIAAPIRAMLPREPVKDTDIALLAEAADKMGQENYQAAIEALEQMKVRFPGSRLLDPGLFLLGDCYYHQNPGNFQAAFLNATTAYQEALSRYPGSPQAPRASLMRVLAYMKMDYYTEAIGYLKLLMSDYPDSVHAISARVYLGEVYLKLGRLQLAKAAFDSIIADGYNDDFVMNYYFNLGDGYFKDGLYSQANEVYKEILDLNPDYYNENPLILFQMGEGYYHLKRSDLAEAFLFHFINIVPRDAKADLAMARIGDIYMDTGNDQQAIRMYALTRDQYPETVGGKVGQMRLADYGALRSVFKPEQIFNALEEGSHEATLKMYKDIAGTGEDSPLVELAMYRIGLAYYSQEEQPQAIRAFKDALERFPRGELKNDAVTGLNKALLAESLNLLEQHKNVEMIALYSENKRDVNDESWPQMRSYLAQAYAELGLADQAALLWEANEGMSAREDQRLLGLGKVYLSLARYGDAVRMFETFREQFPDHYRLIESYIGEARARLGLKDPARAIGMLEKAVESGRPIPAPEEIYGELGRLYMDGGEVQKAAGAMEKNLEALTAINAGKERLFMTYSRLGQAYAGLGDKEKAVRTLEAAMSDKPAVPLPESLYLIADTYKKLGMNDQYAAALQSLEATADPFWKNVAAEALTSLKPNEKINQLLGMKTNGNPKTNSARQADAPAGN